ncbi:hypothetical protein [Streptococcus loxodontisalivarius]|uniref:Polysaccharide polymerase n=1 Tax=Streptococcus loxodontisalivarius TaxID=1349415 RepID=A0ABS2PP20_9STRE|nr:hypothetical protein [Streptococcus loxodontisalivarius]MBM7641774.1 hypothetical protein [Streptococcus loxodontisalivarius]
MKINISDLFFYVTFVFIIFFDFLTKTQFISTYPFVNAMIVPGFVFTSILLIITIFLELKMTLGRFVYVIILSVFILILARTSGNYQKVVTLGLLLLAVKNRNLISILKVHLYTVVTLIILLLFCYGIGLLPGGYSLRESTMRYYLGFSYTSYLANFLFHIIITAIFVYKERLSLLVCAILLIINYGVYVLTDTKSAYYLSLLVLLVFICLKVFRLDLRHDMIKNSRISRWVEQIAFPLSTIFVLILTLLYNTGNSFMIRLNQILTYRLMLGAKAIDKYPINLFGHKIVWAGFNTGMEYLYVDSSFLNILLNYGIISIVLFSLGYYILGKKNIYRDGFYMLAFVFLILHSLFDPQYIEISYNPFTLFLSLTLLTHKEVQKIEL